MAIRTYTVGDQSGVKRLDELTGAWQNVPLNLLDNTGQDIDIILYDVMTDPVDPNKVFVCGQRIAGKDIPGIFWSANGGVNWNKCIGDIANAALSGDEIKELWVVDSNVIYATSHCGYCYKSIDGGVTFNRTAADPGTYICGVGNCEAFSDAVHFIDTNTGIIGLSCGNQHTLFTADGGISWVLSPDLFSIGGVTGRIYGIHISTNLQVINILTGSGLWVSLDGGASYDQKSNNRLIHLSWIQNQDDQLWAYGIGSVRLKTIDGGINWTIINPASGSLNDRAGHHYETVAPNDGFFSENADIFSTSDSSQTGTLSEANQFPGGIQAVWTGIGDTPALIPGCTDPTANNFNPIANADCAGVVGGNDLSCCTYEPGPPPEQPCECPVGYTYNESTNECELTETTPANCLPDTYTVRDGDQSPSYSSNGTNFYPDVTTLPWPLSDIVAPANPNVNNLQDAALTPLIAIQNITSPLWGGFGPGGRLFDAGVWANEGVVPNGQSAPLDEWIGFTACVDVPTTGTYSLGFAGDNRVRIKLNGVPLVEVGANGGIYSYTYWSVIELTLPVGNNIIEIEGFNQASTGGNPASFAAEIYSANVATLMAMTSKPELDTVTIWSTFDFIGKEFDLGEQSGCSCPDGYALSNCDGELICVRTDVVPATPCNCYLATNCDDPADTELITIDPLLPPLDLNVTYTFVEFPGKCWTIEQSSDCGANSTDDILVSTGFIDAIDTLGVQDNPDFNWIITSGDVPVPTPAIISNQSFPGYGSLLNALWLNQTVSPHYIGLSNPVIYETTFLIPTGFNPSLVLDLLSDIRATVTLNGNVIGDNSNPVTYPDPLGTPATFSTANPIHFNTGTTPNVLTVEITQAINEINGFALSGAVSSMNSSSTSTEVTVQEIFADCIDCLGVCYRLVDCEGILDSFYTNSQLSGDLSAYVGQIITIVTCPDTCWQLEEADCPVEVTEVIEILNAFPDCETCLPQDPAPVPFVNTNRTVKPGYDTKGCSPKYVEKISCDFAEAMFQKAASKRYGIEFCCSFDVDELNIKKQLMDFKMITDPDACKTITNECCPPCQLTGEICAFDPRSCNPPEDLTGELIVPAVTVIPNCVTLSFNVPKSNPDESYIITGTDCCGNAITLKVSYPHTVTACFDLNFPYTYDPFINPPTVGGNCDCDPEPPFDCFCIQPYTLSTDEIGWITGTDCDGNLFNTEVYGFNPGAINPNPTICVRADGTADKSDNVKFDNNGECDIDNPCEPIVFDCECITPSLVGDQEGFFRGTNCDGIAFDIVLTGGVSYEPICVRNDGQTTSSANVTLTSGGSCTVDDDCTPPVVEDCSFISYIGQVLDPGPGGGTVSGQLCSGEEFFYDLAGGQLTPFICVKPSTIVITGNVNIAGVSPAPCS